MIPPYQATGLIPTVVGVRRRDEIARNLDHLDHLVKAAMWLSGLDIPVRLTPPMPPSIQESASP